MHIIYWVYSLNSHNDRILKSCWSWSSDSHNWRTAVKHSREQILSAWVCVCWGKGRSCQGIIATPARPHHCRHTIGQQHRSDKPSHLITLGHVAHRAPDTAVTSHLHVILNQRDIYWRGLGALYRRKELSHETCISCSSKGKKDPFNKLFKQDYRMYVLYTVYICWN